ncbi:hypothetical protein CRV02_12650 [Arcobacter sp. CECT 8989]|uniref:hypothetical protein n=1 Tax=Arcobacter sp. CECT 8989 TaxID=2044509 RepID=UPI00100B65B8|nr:hypothetical protein [Arcobacter sp. CECT 8989]RXJ99037.1 hypothetical protein CRV02_12650 [Arcobacter sp. CECT 8989]
MDLSSVNSSYQAIQQLTQTQRKDQPSAESLASKIIENSDIDSNGLISSSEFNISDEIFSSMDSNSDGALSSSELEDSISSKLNNLKNQNLSPEEFGSFLSDLGLDVPPPPSQSTMPPPPNSSQMASDIFETNDLDADGLLSLSELGIEEELFSSFDNDEDGNISQNELEEGLNSLFESAKNQEISKDDFEEILSNLGVAPNSSEEAPAQGGGAPMGGGGGGGSSDEEYEDADLNQDGTVTAAEQAIYDGTVSSDSMEQYTLDLVSTLIGALKNENSEDSSDSHTDLSQFKEIMSMVNEQFQDKKTKENIDKFLDYLVS